MFPRDRGTLSPSAYLSILLLAAVRTYGGDTQELRFNADLLESLAQGQGFITDWDPKLQQLVVRAASTHAEHLIVPEEPWRSHPSASSTASSSRQDSPLAQHQPPTQQQPIPPSAQPLQQPLRLNDEQLAALEAIQAVRHRNRMAQSRREAAEAMSRMPQPEEQTPST